MANRLTPLVAGNWKMNGLRADLGEIAAIRDAVAAGRAARAEILVCPPATLLAEAAQLCAGTPVAIGGQDCHPEAYGAHTGDISAEMLKDAGASYVIVGHSERRIDHGESDARVAAKAAAALRAGLKVILCVGETEAERAAGHAEARVAAQLEKSLPKERWAGRLAIAYEPVWAIGTGVTAMPRDVVAMHGFLRQRLAALLREGETVRLLYGGSVKPGNAAELLRSPDINGALVGGASLKAAEFLAIAAAIGGQ
ncbi:MAG: triose-phosphate isomerase [Methylovirgula sp.]|nr:triose-phosphate isomerase [Methylovirgula sp.]